jgi:hypothetical protein
MPIKTSGPLSTTDIVNEFNTTNEWATKPNIMSQFYGASPDIPTAGNPLSFSDFYGASNVVYVSGDEFKSRSDTLINGLYNIKDCNLWTDVLEGLGYDDPSRRYDIIIPANMWLWQTANGDAGLKIPDYMTDKIVIRNFGNIIGKGGDGGTTNSATGKNGGDAIKIENLAAIDFLNQSGAYVAAGGGGGGRGGTGAASGGGGGAGGGNGGTGYRANQSGRTGGTLNRAGKDGGNDEDAYGGGGGGAGGASGAWDEGDTIILKLIRIDEPDAGPGGGGGRILPGTGGAGKWGKDKRGVAGGSSNLPGTSGGGNVGGGGGGWGASGGRGGGANGPRGGKGGIAIQTGNNRLVNIRNEGGTIWGRDA